MQAPTLFIIARDLTHMQVNANIAESDIGRVRPGQPASFRVDAYADEIFTGTVSQVRLQPVIEQNVVSYVTVIEVSSPDLKLKPGMTANVTVAVERLPMSCVSRTPRCACGRRATCWRGTRQRHLRVSSRRAATPPG